ncbi:hypothetical protein ACA910_019256 [Epithemia clementina (nom. ined.)]
MGLLDLFFGTQHSLYHSSHSRGLYHRPGHSILSRRTILLLGDHSSDFPIENCGLPDTTTTTTTTTSLRYLGSIDDTLARPAHCVASGHFGDVQFFMRPSSDADPLGEAFTLGVYNNNAPFSDDEYPCHGNGSGGVLNYQVVVTPAPKNRPKPRLHCKSPVVPHAHSPFLQAYGLGQDPIRA